MIGRVSLIFRRFGGQFMKKPSKAYVVLATVFIALLAG